MRWEGIPIHIQIGDAKTLTVENWETIPDDRQETVEIVGGVAVQDFGHIASGDKISCTITAWREDFLQIVDYWENRTLVDVIDETGERYSDMRVVVKSYSYIAGFKKYFKANIEFWRV